MKINLGVVFGGETVEHEISVISALQAMKHLNREKYHVIPIYIAKNRIWYIGEELLDLAFYKTLNLRKLKSVFIQKKEDGFVLNQIKKNHVKELSSIDIILPIVHGNHVEDGSLQGYFETLGIPYVGSSMLGASLAQDKVVMKQIFKSNEIPVVEAVSFWDFEYYEHAKGYQEEICKLGFPVIVKPAHLGSSIGIQVVKNEQELKDAILNAMNFDEKIVVEKALEHYVEYNCSVLGVMEHHEASIIEEVIPSHSFLTYEDKYKSDGKKAPQKGILHTNRLIPAPISNELKEEIERLSKKVFEVLNLSGICRIDFLYDKDTHKLYVNEPNVIPGSLAFYLWEEKGMNYDSLLNHLIQDALKEYHHQQEKITTFGDQIFCYLDQGKGMKGFQK